MTIITTPPKPKRHRRTKREMAEARAEAEIAAMLAQAEPLARARLALATPGQKWAAARIVNRVVYGPKYRWS